MEATTLKLVWQGYHQDIKVISPPTCVDGLLITHLAESPHKDRDANLEFAYKRSKVLADMLNIPVQESPEVTGTILGLVRGSVERLMDQVIQLQTENERLKENQSCGQCEDDEQNRWCERLEWLHAEYGADSSGCDSGDPLDCVEVEIRQAIQAARKQAAKECIEMISVAIWSKSGTVATAREAIKAVFEIVE